MVDGDGDGGVGEGVAVEQHVDRERGAAAFCFGGDGETPEAWRDAFEASLEVCAGYVDAEPARFEAVGDVVFVVADLEQGFERPAGIGVRERLR